MSLRTLILAASSPEKWRQSGGSGFKQLEVTVRGEPLIHRTFRLASERCDDVMTVVLEPDHERWAGLNAHAALPEPWMGGQGKLLHHHHLWQGHEIVLLYGDVYYTKRTLDRIYGHEPSQPTIYGRANRPGRRLEAFAMRFAPEHYGEVVRVARECCQVGLNGKGAEWRWFLRRHTGADTYSAARVKKLATEANGWVELGHDNTEDFDRFGHVRKWRARTRIPA